MPDSPTRVSCPAFFTGLPDKENAFEEPGCGKALAML